MKQKHHIVRRYIIFLMGLFCVAFGIAFVTKAGLGTSAISAIPYTLSLALPAISMGKWTILFNGLLLLGQWILMKGTMPKLEVALAMVMTLLFGNCVDFGMWILGNLNPQLYLLKVLCLCAGICIMAFGVYLEVVGDVVMLPGDGFSRAIASVTGKNYGTMKFLSDSAMVLVAAVLCILCFHSLVSVREGTVLAAVMVGNIVRVYNHLFQNLAKRIVEPEQYAA